MHADLCSADDREAVGRLDAILADLGATLAEVDAGFGTEVRRYRVGAVDLLIHRDEVEVAVEGPVELVARVVAAVSGS